MNDEMNNIFKLLNNIKQTENKKNLEITNRNRNRMNELVFGEEQIGFIPVQNKNNARGVMTREQFENVRTLAKDITLHFYGESKFQTFIMGVYKEFFNSRQKQGFQGMKGMNMKGIVCAILYLIMQYEHKAKINLSKLIKAANEIKGTSTTKVNVKMVNKYITIVIDHLKVYSENKNARNTMTNVDYNIDQSIRTLAYSIGYDAKKMTEIRKLLYRVPSQLKHKYTPHHTAASLVYIYATIINSRHRINIQTKLKISPHVLKTIVPKFETLFVKNISMLYNSH